MQLVIKIFASLIIILTATGIAKKFPSVAGLIAVMPLTGALVFAWVHIENKGDASVMRAFLAGALYGIIPSIIFFLATALCIKKGVSLPATLLLSFSAWLIAAMIHRWFLTGR
ncbi:MAG: DUF3147 family protein [Actinomycetota bacterium]|nr:DUF3147 family protein [Actinomycetota bacterium]